MNETKRATHTPTPWTYNYRGDIGNEVLNKGVIMNEGLWGETKEQATINGLHIVKCVNAHDALVTALRECVASIRTPDALSEVCAERAEKLLASTNADKLNA